MASPKAKTKPIKPSERWPADKIERRAVTDLTVYPDNPRLHSDAQVAEIAASMREWGWTVPVLIDEDNGIIAGHGRVTAAEKLGITEVPVVVARGWSAAQKRAYVIADNQIPQNSTWDQTLLRINLTQLAKVDYPLHLTGFDDIRLATFGVGAAAPQSDPDEEIEPQPVAISKLGDIWLCGQHRILCGDSLDIDQVKHLLDGEKPQLANCDAPYGISIVKRSTDGGPKAFGKKGNVHGQARLGPALRRTVHAPARNAIIKPGVYAPIIGDDTTETAIRSFALMSEIGIPAIVLWGGNYFANELPASRCWLVWDKQNTGSFADVELAWTNQDAIARIFHHQWSGLIKASERGEKRVHPTQKPVALVEWVIETIAPKAQSYLDLFLGSGSSLIACERKGIACFGSEMSPHYIDAAVRRWCKFTGKKAMLQGTKKTFEQVVKERSRKAA
jgi:hypothetical protein